MTLSIIKCLFFFIPYPEVCCNDLLALDIHFAVKMVRPTDIVGTLIRNQKDRLNIIFSKCNTEIAFNFAFICVINGCPMVNPAERFFFYFILIIRGVELNRIRPRCHVAGKIRAITISGNPIFGRPPQIFCIYRACSQRIPKIDIFIRIRIGGWVLHIIELRILNSTYTILIRRKLWLVKRGVPHFDHGLFAGRLVKRNHIRQHVQRQ